MRDVRETVADIPGRLQVSWSPDISEVAKTVVTALSLVSTEPVPVVPSTLAGSGDEVAGIRAALRTGGLRTRAILPRALLSAAVRRRGGAGWRPVEVGGRTFRMDARLDTPYVALVLVDEGHRSGPFVLDLPSRYLHPLDRARLVAMPDRLRHLADIAAPVPPCHSVLLTPVDQGWLTIVTRDPIAAELWALGLAERYLDTRLEMQGPWEDPTVQRATELEMGVRVPQDMVPELDATVRPGATARELLEATAMRLGMTMRDA